MADLQQFRSHEALNTTAAGNFSVGDASSGGLGGSSGASIQAGSSADVTNTKHMDLASTTHQIMIYAAGDIYFNFATSDLDIDADIDLILPGGSLTSLAVPVGMRSARSDTIRFNFNSTSTTAHVVRIVEI
tara:strand:- start:133 stop:525 length:393 start_codon:yes stop_codon:yes gene_type:complete